MVPLPFQVRRMQFLFILVILMLLSTNGAEVIIGPVLQSGPEPSLGPSLESSPEPSPEPSLEASAESSFEPALPPMTMSTLVDESYMRQVDFIRQGLPMPLVRSFYNNVLKEAVQPECRLASGTLIAGRCTTPLLEDSDGYAVKSLRELISQDESRPVTEKFFPDLVAKEDLPPLADAELEKTLAAKSKTLQALNQGAKNGWEVSVFPNDDEIRYDPRKNASCTELAEKMPYYSLTMSAPALTAFVFGMAARITLINGDSPQARMILDNHVKLMYVAARCNRMSGDKLEVPTRQLDALITKASLALIATSVGSSQNSWSSLPPFEAVKDVIEGSWHFFGEEIERMTSLESFGKINYLTWTGDTVSSETLDSRMAKKATLQQFSDYYASKNYSDPVGPCLAGFSSQLRLATCENPRENCCAETCIIGSGRPLDVFIVNEMCCAACNELKCDLNKLAKVIAVQAFRFARSEDK